MGAPSISIRRRIQWFDTDSSTKYHNTAPLRLMEEGEAALLDRLGIVREVYGWLPRPHVEIDYHRPLRFWDEVEIEVEVAEVGRSSITYRFAIRREGRDHATGTVVAVLIDEKGRPRAWPPEHRRLLTGEASGPGSSGRR
jgi:YbgC/YbaW family acyl-CoA thioester hydrolase